MGSSGATPKVEHLDLSDDDTEALFASPSRPETKPRPKATKSDVKEVTVQPSRSRPEDTETGSKEAREAALRKELAGIRNINQVIEGVVDSLEHARGNMDTVSRTVNDASTLLNTWTRILSQTEHNQRLILDPSWHGATQDMADMENESLLKQQEKERREIEEAQRREARARKAEEDDRKRLENTGPKSSRGARGRGRGSSRGGIPGQSTSQRGSMTPARSSGSRVARAGSGIGRGPRGRSRGT
ncbi:MAG: hypothetical protein LQ339_003113 [Xanthoria mediterranea]|nr:MAG: hypothetical protein LQ339_003113 [Xanthoria mediterranea]